MTDSTKAGLREEVARTLIARRFGLGGLLMFDIPAEAAPDQRAHLEARARQALAEADAVIAGPLTDLLSRARAPVSRSRGEVSVSEWRLTGRSEWRLYPHGNSGWISEEWSDGRDLVWRWKGDGPPAAPLPTTPTNTDTVEG